MVVLSQRLRSSLRTSRNLIVATSSILRGQAPFFSLDVSDRCPIGCQCYWRAQARVAEMSDDRVVTFVSEQIRRGKIFGVLIGGEPYVRRTVLPRIAEILPGTWVVTSATTPLLVGLPRTTHFISVDGADEETHDQIRRSSGLFNRVLKNVTAARKSGEFPAYVHGVLNKLNFRQVGSILRFWRENGLVDGVTFSTVTPIRPDDPQLCLETFERDWIVTELLSLKKEFGDFLFMTPTMIQHLSPTVTRRFRPGNCPTARYVVSFDAAGNRRAQCVLSEKADCSQCGCVITAMLGSLLKFPPSLATASLVLKAVQF